MSGPHLYMIQRDVLLKLIEEKGYRRGIEIGTLGGDLVKFLLDAIKELDMISVDHNPCAPAYDVVKENPARFRIVRERSDDALPALPNEVDFVWIDGDHSEEQVKRDIVNYWPLVKIGGMIGGHDYTAGNLGVKNAVDGIFRNAVNLGDDLTWWVWKKHSLK